MLKQLFVAATVALVLSGCKNVIDTITGDDTSCAVIVGVENSKFAGNCPGAKRDSNNMTSFLKKRVGKTVTLQDKEATKSAVKKALSDAVESYDYVVFYYSGHGGSEALSTTGIEEDDGQDEFLCLYDTWMLDNEIWNIISKAKGKVFLIFDCCHSETMFRSPGVTLQKSIRKARTTLRASRASGFKMLCWSGCPDSDYSYGSAAGGVFTNTLLDKFTGSDSYASWWNKVINDDNLLANEEPQQTSINWNVMQRVFK